ncbi:adenylyl cyclase [Azospirillum thermophilum]|uniref:Adenylyl cyclase n=1 Tax=Azospirillum thermophilum TaxID=2202148 RepID=A0A2S2CL93_9PROT|nr:adenylyl cyclase [Azospirillum thermophilum]
MAQVVTNGVWADYRTVGECVHVAAKLQQRADTNSAQLSRDTLDLVPVGLTVSPAGSLKLAPDAPPISAYILEGARAVRRTATDLMASTTAPLVGREVELQALFDLAAAVERGSPQVLMLRGEAGIGKSRLVSELLRDERTRSWGLLQWPQMPIRRLGDPEDLEAVAQSLAIHLSGRTDGEAPAQLAAAADAAGGRLAGDAVRGLFGLPAEDPLWSGLDPAQRMTLAVEGLVAAVLFAVTACQGRCLMILVEDAHWARPVMVRFLDMLAAALSGPARAVSGGCPVLLLATSRPPSLGAASSGPEGWVEPRIARRIELGALDTEEARRFLDHWLGDDPSLAELKSRVSDRSQGVPLYLEETLRTMEAAGDITGGPGAFRLVKDEVTLRLPRSVHGLLAARIDLLDSDPRRVLMRAAVVGNTFDVGLLQVLRAVPETALADQLAYLEQAGFVARARLLPNLEYVFRHALIREVAYVTLTKGDRKAMHVQLVAALRTRRDSDLPNRVELTAYHAFMAEDWPIAYAFGRRAGQRAEERSRLEDASDFYRKAISSIHNLPDTRRNTLRTIDLLIALPRSMLPRGAVNVHDHLTRARDLSLQQKDLVRLARTSSMLASFSWAFAEVDTGISLCREALTVLDSRNDRQTRIQLTLRLGGIQADKGHFLEAIHALDTAGVQLMQDRSYSRYGLATVALVHYNSIIARCYAEIGRNDQALASARKGLEAAMDSGHAFSQLFANAHLGWVNLIREHHDQAVPPLEYALLMCDGIRSPLWRPLICGGLALARVKSGQHAEGLKLFDESFRSFGRQSHQFDRIHPRVSFAQVQLWYAEALAEIGDLEKAAALAQDAFESAVSTGQHVYEARAMFLIAKYRRRFSGRGDSDGETMARRALDLATRLAMKPLQQQCERLLTERVFSLS